MRVKIHPTFIAYLLGICCFASPSACLAMVAALTAHELSHYAVARALREPIERVELAPFGGMMTYAPGHSASKGLRGVLIAGAGPLGNYALILLVLRACSRFSLPAELVRQLIIANLSMIVINLMPALPLDGGAILFSVGYYLCGVSRLIALLCGAGVLLGASLMGLAVYGSLTLGRVNLSLLVVGGYLIVCSRRSRSAMLTQNVYTVVQERMRAASGCRRVAAYRVPGDTPVTSLLPLISRAQSALFLIDAEDGAPRLLDERDACRAMLHNPRATAGEAAEIPDKS